MAGFSTDIAKDEFIIEGVAGENLSPYEICYLKSDGKYWKAKADSATTMPGVVIALEAIEAESTGSLAVSGRLVTNGAWSWTPGAFLYVSEAAGGRIASAAPSGSGEQVQILGYAETATTIRFIPNLVLVELA